MTTGNTVNDVQPDAPTVTGPAEPIQLPEDGWLRGYFHQADGDVLGVSQASHGVYKNVDYMRLRDVALHELNPQPGQTILDVACAAGSMMVYCGLQGATVYGQDLSEDYVAKANAALQRFHVTGEAVCGDAKNLQFPDNHMDAIISFDFFEHVTDEIKIDVLREFMRVLKPGGKLVMKTPNLSYLRLSLFYKRLRAMARLQDPRKLTIPHTPGTADPQHIGLTTRRQFTRCLLDAGVLNYRFVYAPLRRFGMSSVIEMLSTEIPWVRDALCEDVFCVAYKPIAMSHFPD